MRSVVLLGALLLGACASRVMLVDDAGGWIDDDDDLGTTTDAPPVPGTSTTSTTSPPPDTATASSTADPTAPPEPVQGTCRQMCQTPQDCCDNVPDCPGAYPNNWSCIEGVCFFGGCTQDQECLDSIGEGFVCVDSPWGMACLPTCEAFNGCDFESWTCGGVSPSGTPYCTPEDLCDQEQWGYCEEVGTCDPATQTCVCFSDAECTLPRHVCHFG